jgi:cyclophilin family peptidyl-prolyl cis-trans isomerase
VRQVNVTNIANIALSNKSHHVTMTPLLDPNFFGMKKIWLIPIAMLLLAACTPKPNIDSTLEKNLNQKNLIAPQNNNTNQKPEDLSLESDVDLVDSNDSETSADNMNKPKQWNNPPKMQIDPDKIYNATLKTTAGDITIKLNAAKTPQTVNNFIFLAKQGFYEDVIFHRVIDGFMIQGGDPTGTGAGGPGYKFPDEPFTGEYTKGTLAMANAGPNTNGSQFFIMHSDVSLPKNYVIFGQVTAGLSVVDAIATAETVQDGRENSTPAKPVKILSVEIVEE